MWRTQCVVVQLREVSTSERDGLRLLPKTMNLMLTATRISTPPSPEPLCFSSFRSSAAAAAAPPIPPPPSFISFSCREKIVFCGIRNLPLRSFAGATFARKRAPPPSEEEDDSDEQLEATALKPSIVDELLDDDDEDDNLLFLDDDDLIAEESADGDFVDDDYFDVEESLTYAGDGAAGGGISLAGTWWDKEALALAEQVSRSFDGELKIYAFRTLANSSIQIRIETTRNKSGSPSMSDIEAFTSAYRELLDKAEAAKTLPDNLWLEVSSPGVERAVRIPQDLDRFKERPMYVKYLTDVVISGSSSESDGVFRLISYDIETRCCTWGLADVRVNREKAGKGRPMSKKQREWRVTTAFDSLRLVRLYSEA